MTTIEWLAVKAALDHVFEADGVSPESVELAFRNEGLAIGPVAAVPTVRNGETLKLPKAVVRRLEDAFRDIGVIQVKEKWDGESFDAIPWNDVVDVLEAMEALPPDDDHD